MTPTSVLDLPAFGDSDFAGSHSRLVLHHLASRWGSLVLRQLFGRERRYSELRAAIDGISEKMLARTLRDLERDGLVARTRYSVVPPRVAYTLTPLGRECAELVEALIRWIETHVHELIDAQRAYDAMLANVLVGTSPK
jgi:DNA-binding HxlR family transcriptional regulator